MVGKPSGGGKREPPSVRVCVVANEPSAVSHGNSGRSGVNLSEDGRETIYGTFRTEVNVAVMATA